MRTCDGFSTYRVLEEAMGDNFWKLKKSVVPQKLLDINPNGKDISIVVPTYNAMPELSRTLQAAIYQTYDRGRREIVVSDNCSTDETWKTINLYAARYPDLFFVCQHEENSGSPGKNRNTGLSMSTGTYVFINDADDWMAPRAIEKMVHHAVKWNSDMMLVKMAGINRDAPISMFRSTQAKVENVLSSPVVRTLGPWKLYNREFLIENNLVFPDKGNPDDVPFVLDVLLTAKIISVASDYVYYYHTQRDAADAHVVQSSWWKNPETDFPIFERICKSLETQTSEENRTSILMGRLYEEVSSLFKSISTNFCGKEKETYYEIIKNRIKPFYTEKSCAMVSVNSRLILDAAILGSMEKLSYVVERREEEIFKEGIVKELDGRLIFTLETPAGALESDIGNNIVYTHNVHVVESEKNSFKLAGEISSELEMPYDVQDIKLQFLLKDKHSDEEYVIDCSHHIDEGAIMPGKNTIRWSSVLDLRLVNETVVNPSKKDWFVYVRFTWNAYAKDIRIGQLSNDRIKKKFLALETVVDNVKYKARTTPAGNFCIKSSIYEGK